MNRRLALTLELFMKQLFVPACIICLLGSATAQANRYTYQKTTGKQSSIYTVDIHSHPCGCEWMSTV